MILHKFLTQAPTTQNLSAFNLYMANYPLLKSNLVLASIYEYFYACLGINGFAMNDGVKGEKYMQLLMHQLDEHPDNNSSYNHIIAKLFAEASVYYFHKQGKAKAVAVLNTGLKYEPTDDELLRKLSADSH